MGYGWLALPREWVESFGEIARFGARVLRDVWGGRVVRFFGEALRQAGILILSSTLVITGLVFIIGLQCGIEGAYLLRAQGTPAYAGLFSAWCDLRELVPYAFGYMMAAKVGTGIVAELGSMRISDEIDALEVMSVPSFVYLVCTRVIAAVLSIIPLYLFSLYASFFATELVTTRFFGLSPGVYQHYFRLYLPSIDIVYSLIKAMVFAVAVSLIHCYYGYYAKGGPAGVGVAVGRAIRLSIVTVVILNLLLSLLFWGGGNTVRVAG